MPVCTQCGRKHSIFSHAIGTTLCTKCQKISQLRAKLTDDNPVVRAQVAAELFKLGDDTAHDLLIAALQDQRTSVFAVIAFNERGRFDELIPYLNKVLLDVKNTWALCRGVFKSGILGASKS